MAFESTPTHTVHKPFKGNLKYFYLLTDLYNVQRPAIVTVYEYVVD